MIQYSEKKYQYNKSICIGTSFLIELLKELSNENIHITFDNFYCNIDSITFLNKNNINFTGTFTKTIKSFPKEIREINLSKGVSKLFKIKNTNINMFINNDKIQIQLVSNAFGINCCSYKN